VDTQLPLTYIHLLGYLVKMTLLVMAAEAGLALAAYNAEAGGNNDDGISAVLAKFFQLSIWAVALQGMLHVQATLSNPFSRHRDCFPSKSFFTIIRGEASAFLHASVDVDVHQAGGSA
jgi:hypothetical protein